MVNCLKESQLELIALGLLEDPQLVLPDHIGECHFCNSMLDDFSSFYVKVEAEIKKIDVQALQSALYAKNTDPHTFSFFEEHRLPVHESQTVYTKTLAADSEMTSLTKKTQNVGVFSSSDERLMIRLLKSKDEKYSLFLLSDSPELYQNVLVRFVGMDAEYVTDRQGSINIGEIELPDMDHLGIEVRTASESYDLQNVFSSSGKLIGEREVTLERSDHRKIKLEIQAAGNSYALKITLEEKPISSSSQKLKIMVIREENRPEVKISKRGVVVFREIQNPGNLQVKIFE